MRLPRLFARRFARKTPPPPPPPEDGSGGPPALKRTWLALLLTIPFPGLGQIYNGQWLKGIVFICVHIVNFALIHWFVGLLTAPVFWLYAIFDAVDTAEKINAARRKAYVDRRYGGAEPDDEGGPTSR